MPWLASPAHLAYADTNGKWIGYKHLLYTNEQLAEAGFAAAGFGSMNRLGIHLPFQHGKTWLASKYFPAWLLLLFPWLRIIVASHSESYSANQIGAPVKDVVERFGPMSGVKLRQDTKAKGEWTVDAGKGLFESGGMVCRGFQGGINGRSCDLLLIDDVIKDAEMAMSPTMLEKQWDWYTSVAYSRLSKNAAIVMVTTRWVKGDLPGRIYKAARDTGEQWKEIKLKAIAEDDDPLGRQPGEPLWPEERPIERLELIKKQSPRWFQACYQQTPTEEEGLYFRPRPTKDHFGWPRCTDLGDAWSIARQGGSRDVVRKADCVRIIAVDWALAKKKIGGDYQGLVIGDMLPDKRLLVAGALRRKARIDSGEGVKAFDEICREFRPRLAASDDDMIAVSVATECRRYPAIPEIRRLPMTGNKLVRAGEAMAMGENSRIILPSSAPWLDDFETELTEFDGLEGGLDDMVDSLGIVARVAQQLRGSGGGQPSLLLPGRG